MGCLFASNQIHMPKGTFTVLGRSQGLSPQTGSEITEGEAMVFFSRKNHQRQPGEEWPLYYALVTAFKGYKRGRGTGSFPADTLTH